MRTSTRALGVGLVGLALLGTVTRGTPARAQDQVRGDGAFGEEDA